MMGGASASYPLVSLALLLCCRVDGFVLLDTRRPVTQRQILLNLRLNSNQASSNPSGASSLLESLYDKRILVVGGSGRVGGSVVKQLVKNQARVTVGGRNEERWNEAWSRYQQMWTADVPLQDFNVGFSILDCRQADSVSRVLQQEKFDLVVHTAGPFQGKVDAPNGVLEACVTNRVPYVDVCDDYCTARAAKAKFSEKAQDAKVPCIISTGCWVSLTVLPSTAVVSVPACLLSDVSCDSQVFRLSWPSSSSTASCSVIRRLKLPICQLTSISLQQDQVVQVRPYSHHQEKSSFDRLRSCVCCFRSLIGVTLLVATFLILAEKALTIVDGRRREVQAMNEYITVNFGPVVGDREVAHLNLLETASIHDVLGIPNITTRFGTAPAFWNTLLGVMAQLPPSILSNEDLMSKLAVFSLPIVRVVDYFAGATNAMRCDVSATATKTRATAIYAHENLEICVGECVVPFCGAILAGKVAPGVWFPEEAIGAGDDAAHVLQLASIGAHTSQVLGDVKREEVWGQAERDLVVTLAS